VRAARGDVDEALGDYGKALRLEPGLAEAFLGRAAAWVKHGRFDKAIADCDRALRADAALVDAYVLRGEARVEQGEFEPALEDFARALKLDPKNARAYRSRGQAALRQGDPEKAVADLTRSLRLDEKNAEALHLRATARQLLGRHDEALADLNQAVVLDGRYTAALCNHRASLHASRGEYELALADYAVVLQLDPANCAALAGREQALQARQARPAATNGTPPAAPPRPVRGRKARPAADAEPTGETMVIRVGQAPPTMVAIELDPAAAEVTETDLAAAPTQEAAQGNGAAGTAEGQFIEDLPEVESVTLPDQGVPPPGEKPPPVPVKADAGSNPRLGPIEARQARHRQRAEADERAALWAAMRDRERKRAVGQKPEEDERSSSGGGLAVPPWLFLAAGAVVVLGLLGGGAYFFFFANREPRLTAEQAWQEFDANTTAANKKYRGKFVQVTGKVKVFTENKRERLFFDRGKDAKWGIEFTVRGADKDKVKDGEEVTLRGRFGTRKAPDGNLVLSNCTVVGAGKS